MKKWLLLFLACLISIPINAQDNLLKNSNADSDSEHWIIGGDAAIEKDSKNNRIFIIRNKGFFQQIIQLNEESAGKYILLIGRGASERVNSDGAITGLPYLYGYLYSFHTPKGGRINTYLTNQKLLGRVQSDDEWTVMYGIFQVPKGTVAAQVSLNQAERKGVPQNGSAARFDDVGLYLFETETDALNFVKQYD